MRTIETAQRQERTHASPLQEILTTRPESPTAEQPVYTIRGLSGTLPDLLRTPKGAMYTILTAQSVVFSHMRDTHLLDAPEVGQKTAEQMTQDRERLFNGLREMHLPGDSPDGTPKPDVLPEIEELVATAATIYQRKSEVQPTT